jgi:hypothetical protein
MSQMYDSTQSQILVLPLHSKQKNVLARSTPQTPYRDSLFSNTTKTVKQFHTEKSLALSRALKTTTPRREHVGFAVVVVSM